MRSRAATTGRSATSGRARNNARSLLQNERGEPAAPPLPRFASTTECSEPSGATAIRCGFRPRWCIRVIVCVRVLTAVVVPASREVTRCSGAMANGMRLVAVRSVGKQMADGSWAGRRGRIRPNKGVRDSARGAPPCHRESPWGVGRLRSEPGSLRAPSRSLRAHSSRCVHTQGRCVHPQGCCVRARSTCVRITGSYPSLRGSGLRARGGGVRVEAAGCVHEGTLSPPNGVASATLVVACAVEGLAWPPRMAAVAARMVAIASLVVACALEGASSPKES
jgi:hypothetical protein